MISEHSAMTNKPILDSVPGAPWSTIVNLRATALFCVDFSIFFSFLKYLSFTMASSLTYQLRNQSPDDNAKQTLNVPPTTTLPSPPNSSYGADEAHAREGEVAATAGSSFTDEPSLTHAASSFGSGSISSVRRDSLPTHFNALTIQQFSTSLPENYTIDHSSPIPIQSMRRPSYTPRSESPLHLAHSPVSTATAAATGGRTIRHRRQSESGRQRSQQIHRCEDCGKVYKHPNCLAKHRWEHSEQWEITSKLLLTKHQQVQMLEAAAILVSMDSSRRRSQQMQGNEELLRRQSQQQQQVVQAENHPVMNEDGDEEEEDEQTQRQSDDDDISIDLDDDEGPKAEQQQQQTASLFALNGRSTRRRKPNVYYS